MLSYYENKIVERRVDIPEIVGKVAACCGGGVHVEGGEVITSGLLTILLMLKSYGPF